MQLDDADEVSATVLNQIDGVTAILCDDAYWTVKGGRPHKQEPRQSYNMQRVYGGAELPTIAHVDVDEYLYSDRPIDDVLAAWDDDRPFLRVAPAEALHDPTLTDDIFTARQFRLPFPNKMTSKKKMSVLGDYTPLLSQNMLSHKVGKSFFKTGRIGSMNPWQIFWLRHRVRTSTISTARPKWHRPRLSQLWKNWGYWLRLI